ncbi:hypothetical protein [Nannocystis pusilla]|uniref:hypothetical protein n=1 Tax=Nannocystis pusilla TaxID=889268 RepID=UPI003B776FF1
MLVGTPRYMASEQLLGVGLPMSSPTCSRSAWPCTRRCTGNTRSPASPCRSCSRPTPPAG